MRSPPHHKRFIPALAGNTSIASPPCWLISVHPRACGEHANAAPKPPPRFGSSPRLRGTLIVLIHDIAPIAVHPRACGEHTTLVFRSCIYRGSSPRLRGTQHHARARACIARFIPALAGNTNMRRISRIRCAVHPRACGEHFTGLNAL